MFDIDMERIRLLSLIGVPIFALGCGAERPTSTEDANHDGTTAGSSSEHDASSSIGPGLWSAARPRPSDQEWKAWHDTMLKRDKPASPCFRASYPSADWESVPCGAAEQVKAGPLLQRERLPEVEIHPEVVGGGGTNDNMAMAPGPGLVNQVFGYFKSKSGARSVNDGDDDSWSLQINSNGFHLPYCSQSPDPSKCYGWQQFVYLNDGGSSIVYMQYWIVNYNHSCPSSHWTRYGADCYRNSDYARLDPIGIAFLTSAELYAYTDSSGDHVAMFDSSRGTLTVASGPSDVLNLRGYWTGAEFNIFGRDGQHLRANFSSPTTLVGAMDFSYGSDAAPRCVMQAMSGESNNLTLLPSSCCVAPRTPDGRLPSLTFTESTSPTTTQPPFCLLNDIMSIEAPLFL